jgi:hypothetical protein
MTTSLESSKILATVAPAISQTFVLYYLHGGNAHVKQKNFNHNGTKESAITRGKSHCEVMGYRFIRVEPFFSNLDSDEKRHTE